MADVIEIILRAGYRFIENLILVGTGTIVAKLLKINFAPNLREIIIFSLLLLGARFIYLLVVAVQLLLSTPKSVLFKLLSEDMQKEIKTELIKQKLKDLI